MKSAMSPFVVLALVLYFGLTVTRQKSGYLRLSSISMDSYFAMRSLIRSVVLYHFANAVRQFKATVRDDASLDCSMMRNRLPSGARSQLIGPVRIPVSTISV
jgi:hypothetical protein